MAINGNVGSKNNINQAIGYYSDYGDPIERQVDNYRKLMNRANKEIADSDIKYRELLKKKQRKQDEQELKRIQDEIWEANATKAQKFAKNLGQTLMKVAGQALLKSFSSIDSYINTYTQYMGTMTTRLQGTSLTYERLMKDVSANLGTSPFLKQTDMISNLNKFIEAGISYNLESRAYIATATAKIANTFNAFDSSLLRIIRIQQADSTVARLGMESLLTKFLNAQFEDTSYLNMSQDITGLLTEAESLMGYKKGTEFEYTVQKWLGSLSSLGVSNSTITSLATGLGYLGSGNISAMANNTGLQTLFAMAAGRAGIDYGSLFTGGLTPSATNALLSNIVGIGQGIATSGNNVTKAAFANLLGLSVSDLVSLTNVTSENLKAISQNIVTYEGLRQETTNQLASMGRRTTMTEMVSNVMSNTLASLGANVATNPGLYALWETASLMAQSGLDYDFNVGFLGTGTSTKLSTIMKTGVVGGGLITSLANAMANIISGNLLGTNLSVWGEQQTRGTGLASTAGMQAGSTTSGSSYIGSVDSSNISTFEKAQQQEAQQYVGEGNQDSVVDKINNLLTESIAPNIANIYNILENWNTNSLFKYNK